ncbi:MAG: hypothetical protein IIA07_12920 [Proteobacteria bacterium]|nr:hypothetical protein [Pseudomonadota bacterium]
MKVDSIRVPEPPPLSKQLPLIDYWLSRTTIVVAAVFVIVFMSIAFYVAQLQADLNRSAVIERAANLSEAVAAFRTLYTSEVVQRLKDSEVLITHDYKEHAGAIPLPATLSMQLGKQFASSIEGLNARLYSPYPFPWRRAEGGLKSDFDVAAWLALNNEPDKPYYRVELSSTGLQLRYAVADRLR